jgi:hypothetical protein
MQRLIGLCVVVMIATSVVASPLVAQQAQIFGEEPVLDPMQKKLKGDVLILRDSLYAVDAVSARLVRAKVASSPAVVTSSARALRDECHRATRAIGVMRGEMRDVGTNDPRGKKVIADYNKGLDELKRAMVTCDKSLEAALASTMTPPDQEPLFRTALASTDAIRVYEEKLYVMLKTLQIPVDPKGFKSAISM